MNLYNPDNRVYSKHMYNNKNADKKRYLKTNRLDLTVIYNTTGMRLMITNKTSTITSMRGAGVILQTNYTNNLGSPKPCNLFTNNKIDGKQIVYSMP